MHGGGMGKFRDRLYPFPVVFGMGKFRVLLSSALALEILRHDVVFISSRRLKSWCSGWSVEEASCLL